MSLRCWCWVRCSCNCYYCCCILDNNIKYIRINNYFLLSSQDCFRNKCPGRRTEKGQREPLYTSQSHYIVQSTALRPSTHCSFKELILSAFLHTVGSSPLYYWHQRQGRHLDKHSWGCLLPTEYWSYDSRAPGMAKKKPMYCSRLHRLKFTALSIQLHL